MIALAIGVVMAAMLVGACDETDPAAAKVIPVKVAGKKFYLEVAADDQVRMKGLGSRTHIEDDGGMIFSFTPGQTRVQTFVMRDCLTPIDIIYLDGAGRVLSTHTMPTEPPRAADGSEGKVGEFGTASGTAPADKYEARLTKTYSSRFPSPFVIEVQEGTIKKLGVKEGDLISFDVSGLKRRTK